jgi:hypothetical protein
MDMTASGAVSWLEPWLYLLIAVATPVFATAFATARYLVERPRHRPLPKWRNRPRSFFFDWAVIWTCWIPVWLSGWPGFWCYDANSTHYEVQHHAVSTWWPPLHTYLSNGVQIVVARLTGSQNLGIAAFIALQSLMTAAAFAYALRRLRAWGVPRTVRWGGLAYFALFPTISLFSLMSTRNNLFSAIMLTLAVCLVDAIKQTPRPKGKQWWRWALVALVAVAAIATRRDAVYAFLLFTPVVLIFFRPARKALAACFVTATIAGLLLEPVLYLRIMGVQKAMTVHMYSVPLQQMARVYAMDPDSLTTEQRQELESFVRPQNLAQYRPQLADKQIVGAYEPQVEGNTKAFIRLWAEVGATHPAAYVDAFVALTVQGWLPGALIDAYAIVPDDPIDPAAGTSYFCFITQWPGVADPKGPQFIRDIYGDFSKYSRVPFEIPVVSWLWSPGSYLWVTLFAFVLTAAWAKQAKQAKNASRSTRATGAGLETHQTQDMQVTQATRGHRDAFLPVALLLLATCVPTFLGPTMLVRYFLQLFYCAPLVAAFLADPRVYEAPKPRDEPADHQSVAMRSGGDKKPPLP